eukprot:5502513-Amphidinium_carterae.2
MAPGLASGVRLTTEAKCWSAMSDDHMVLGSLRDMFAPFEESWLDWTMVQSIQIVGDDSRDIVNSMGRPGS